VKAIESAEPGGKTKKDDPSDRATIPEMLLSKQFILLYLMNILSLCTGYFVVG
jgi:hypothetical protein